MTAETLVTKDDHITTLVHEIVHLLDEKKAEHIVTLDVHKKATFCDYIIIASGNVSRQIITMADHIVRYLKDQGIHSSVEGAEQGDWVLIDGGDVVIHLFRQEVRERYNLEKMWAVD